MGFEEPPFTACRYVIITFVTYTSMSESNTCHHRRLSSSSGSHPRSPSPPSLTYHPTIIPIPTPALVESVAGAAHYSGIKLDHETSLKHRRGSHDTGDIHTQLKPGHKRVLEDLKELYGCRPTLEIFERSWNKDAEFEDPLSKCKGYNQYAAQWFALPKLFAESKTISTRVMSSTHTPNRLVYTQSQLYTTHFLKHQKMINSIIVVDMDDDEKIIRMVDQWDGKDLPSWFGAHFLRVLNAKITPWLISTPKLPAS
ncbi:hypothetical protein D9615_001812 [Tricholomella constricta]|uniref:Uncharacterized protein n=1 Tax=Tricholomella constricta TaxID=117010 RepID=A0A8H5HNW3_9AGAR|nr:hypothetical protein D9615_001812 [Tricholomella constricta]